MPKIDLNAVEQTSSTRYPPPFDRDVKGRHYRRLAPAHGLTEFGVSEVTLDPGAWSSQRHWHDGEDEFLVMIEGEAVLVEDEGRTPMRAGDMAAWPKGVRNGHHLINESDADVVYLEIGDRLLGDAAFYPDDDLHVVAGPDGKWIATRKDGTPF